jgi:neopullulanase
VREYIYGIAERWLRFDIDGWRLDVPEDIDEPGFWEEFRRRSLAVNPEAYLVGEIWTPAPEWLAGSPCGSPDGGSDGGRFDGLMNYPLAEAILSFVGAGRLDEELVAKTHEYGRNVRAIDGPEFGRQLERVMTTYEPAVSQLQLNLLDSHDTPRFLSLAGGDRSALRLAMLIQMTLPGAPCIYYGDEIGLEGREDPDCRRSFQWDPALQDGDLRAFVAGLVALRRAEPAMRRGRFKLLEAESSTEGSGVAYALESGSGGQSIVVAVNAADVPIRLRIGLPALSTLPLEQVSWPGCEWTANFAPAALGDETLEVGLEARAGAVLKTVANL